MRLAQATPSYLLLYYSICRRDSIPTFYKPHISLTLPDKVLNQRLHYANEPKGYHTASKHSLALPSKRKTNLANLPQTHQHIAVSNMATPLGPPHKFYKTISNKINKQWNQVTESIFYTMNYNHINPRNPRLSHDLITNKSTSSHTNL